jgi:HAE1 family hydrophobic/amphiphilic exporter-1
MVFLQSVKLAFIPAISLPLSLMATFGMMSVLNFSLNNLTLLGLSLAVGFVVDDAIVMLENIARERERGLSAMDAAIVGSQQITFTIIAMTLSLIIVFAPLLFMQGLMGRLFHEFSVTVSIAILASGVIALTFIPMLASRWLSDKPTSHETESLLWFKKLTTHYERSLTWMLARPRLGIGLFFGTLCLSILMFYMVPKGFLPTEDTGQLLGFVEADPSTSFPAMVAKQNTAVAIIAAQPGVIGVMSSVGSGGASGGINTGRIIAKLAPLSKRQRAETMLNELRPKLGNIPGLTVYLQLPPALRIGGRASKSLYQFTLQYSNLKALAAISTQVQNAMQKLPALQDVTSDWQFTGPQIQVDIDRERASTLGISAEQIENTLASAFATQQVSTIYTELDDYQVIVELLPNAQLDPNALRALYLRSSTGKLVPLSAVVHLGFSQGPVSISHQQQLPAITISFNVKPGYALNQAMSQINSLKDKLKLPPALQMNFQGNAQAFADSMSSAGIVLVLSLLAIYVLLGILYESYVHPLTILSGLPSAAVGGLLTLWIFGFELDLYGFIGIILLLGIVKKNAIMMIDFANEARLQGASAQDAIYQACMRRFRPIMMTTFAALFGALPIALAIGAGAESRRPLGLVVVGGLLVSQWLTLYLTPVIYLYLDRWQKPRTQ